MPTCASCGHPNPADARFCNRCGTSLSAAASTPEQLKTITVLFADVTGSTELGERLDPEAVRRVMERYFELAQRVITSHGGVVEKFAGDAVMAVFGIPVLHEDDALRAVRAAADLRASLPVLNAELRHDYDATLELRTGVNTGEAVTAADEWLAVGDAVNVAARLEQSAAPGEILLGPQTFGLVRDAVLAELLEPIALRGKTAPVAVYRLVEVLVDKGPPPRRLDTPMVGRAHQLRMLENVYANVVSEQTCCLFTLLGVAGVGKSRLAAEFLPGLDATVVHGRCLSYGEGITYWPVVSVVKQLLACQAGGGLEADSDQARAIRALLGESGEGSVSADIAWAVRKLLERAAADRPLVVVLDDVHWGEQTFLDLVEQVADLSRGVPILMLCMARPELLDRRPSWGGGKLNATTVLLEPLNGAEADQLIDRLLPPAALTDPALRARVLETAAGNPLFLEEIASVVAASPGGFPIPPTIHALLAARLDQLDPAERRVLERGSVEGNSFHLGAVEALGPEEASVPAKLVTLVRKDLVRPASSVLPGDDAFRFRHLLIRDAAYDGLPKSARMLLHERFASWLDERAGDLSERDEIVGYHLEQAYRYRRELGPVDDAARATGAAAADRLAVAGRRALDRDDNNAAANLLERASELIQPADDISVEIALFWALFRVGRITDAAAKAAATSVRAADSGDRIGHLRAELARVYALLHLDPEGKQAQLAELIERARPVFEAAGDDAALGSLWQAAWGIEHFRCRFGAAADAARRAAEHALAAGERYLASWNMTSVYAAVAYGPTPIPEVLEWLEQQDATPEKPGLSYFWQSKLLPLIGRIDEARALHALDVARMTERGERVGLALDNDWVIHMEAGEFAEALATATRSCQMLAEMGERSWWSTKACEVAQALYSLGQYGEAESWALRAAQAGASGDVITQAMSQQVLAKVAAQHGHADRARTLAAAAVATCEEMQAPLTQGDACLDAAEAHLVIGDHARAAAMAKRAAGYYGAKGATVRVQRARGILQEASADGQRAPA